MCVCVCVCEREREREREISILRYQDISSNNLFANMDGGTSIVFTSTITILLWTYSYFGHTGE